MLSLLPALALASGLDADGSGVPASDSEGSVGLVETAPRGPAGSGAVSLRGGAIAGGLVRSDPSGEETALVGQAALMRAQVAARVMPWLGATATLPVRLGATSDTGDGAPALGDVSAAAWGILGSDRQLALGLGASLPTGPAARYAGSGRLVPTATVSGRTHAPLGGARLELLASAHLAHEGAPDPVEAIGGPRIGAAVRAGPRTERLEGGLSLRTDAPLTSEIRTRRGVPVELGLDGSLLASDAVQLSALVARAVVPGVGAPGWRASAAVSVRWGPRQPILAIPDTRGLLVVDPAGRAVSGAMVALSDGTTLLADASGRVTVPYRARGDVTALGLGTGSFDRDTARVELPWAPVPLTVIAGATDGSAIAPTVRVADAAGTEVVRGSDDRFPLLPGSYTVTVSAEGYGEQQRALAVLKRQSKGEELEVSLLPAAGDARLVVTPLDPEGRSLDDTELQLDGVSVGTTGRGEVVVDGLANAKVEVTVGRDSFRSRVVEADLTDGEQAVDVTLGYAPGTVRVIALGPAGPISDGLVLVDGPQSLPPIDLGPDGEALVQLMEGDWLMALTSPAHGLQHRSLAVTEASPVPLLVPFRLLDAVTTALAADGFDVSDLWIDVRDPSGELVDGAVVAIDGQEVGATSTGGSLQLESLLQRDLTLAISGPGLEPTDRVVALDDPMEVVTVPVRWAPGTVEVAARTDEGPADARIDFAGPASYEGGDLGPPGRRRFEDVPEGRWEVVASHPSGIQVAWTTSGERTGLRSQVDFHLGAAPGDGTLDLCVTDPDGLAVPGARVRLDARPLASTGEDGCVRVDGLREAPSLLAVIHPHHQNVEQTVDLSGPVRLSLPFRPGVVDILVTGLPPAQLTDVLIDGLGPTPVEPAPLRPDGSQRLVLAPGTWDLLASGSAGLASATLTVPDDDPTPQAVVLSFDGAGAGAVVHVVDNARRPVAGVELLVGGEAMARTDANGQAVVPLPDGAAEVQVRGAGLEGAEAAELADGDVHWFEVRPLPRDVPVRATHEGSAVPVTVTMRGPERLPAITFEGSGVLQLPPGAWEVVADPGEKLAAQRAFLTVPREGDVPELAFELQSARVRATATGLELIDVQFDLGQDVADPEYARILEEVAASIVSDPKVRRVQIEGHTDATGDLAFNFELSRRRAASVVDALVALGVPRDLLHARGYGPSRPKADNATEDGRAANRRVEFRVTSTERTSPPP